MIAHQHKPESSDVNLAQVRGAQILAKCQECGGKIHKPLFQPDAQWRDVVIKKRYALVLVTAESDYLTSDGEETEESGWDIVAKDLTEHVWRFQKFQNPAEPSARFIEWDESDES